MLALVSISRAIRRCFDVAEIEVGRLAQERPGKRKRQKRRARPPATASKSKWSRRLRRVRRGASATET